MAIIEADTCTPPTLRQYRQGMDCGLQCLPAARRYIVSLAEEAGLLWVTWINRLVVFIGDMACHESVFILPEDIKLWLMNTPTYREADTGVIENDWICTEVVRQKNQENNCAWTERLDRAGALFFMTRSPGEKGSNYEHTEGKKKKSKKTKHLPQEKHRFGQSKILPVFQFHWNMWRNWNITSFFSQSVFVWKFLHVSRINSTSQQNIFSL